jgi:phosphoesterase RecJ-like protein
LNIKEIYNQIIDKIESNNNFVIIPHHNPDGDAIGSALAVKNFLDKLGKTSTVISPNDYPEFLHWLPKNDSVVVWFKNKFKAKALIEKAEVAIFVDFAQLSRIDEFEENLFDNKIKILFDHHPDTEKFPDIKITDTRVSSTAELVGRFLMETKYLNLIDKDIASCLLTGIITDTGSFNHNSSRPETYEVLTVLLKTGVNKDKIYNKVYNNFSFDRMRLLGKMLNDKMNYLPGFATAYICLSKEEMKDYKFQPGDSEGFVNIPLGIKGVVFSVFFMEKHDKIKISFRSESSFPANEIAKKYFEGGGHKNAAGGQSKLSMEETIKKFKEILEEYKAILNTSLI